MNSPIQRQMQVFENALNLPAGLEREAYLARTCASETSLLDAVRGLLADHQQIGTFLTRPAGEICDTPLSSVAVRECVGETIGPYTLRERLGEGGCGVVYVAEQQFPIKRRVALKVIKLGMDSKAVLARFDAERHALAMMDHPNIARVLDAGTTEAGRPYFVMELVRGQRITDFCDQAALGTRERLELFTKVCQAIQHAHQKGVIHRDIKPGNVLVTLHDEVPVPKVIDFGIAKATEGRLTEATVYTELHQFIGTPAYMSPEQAGMSGLDIDTRSDIYSLGVLLYEMLTGRTPFPTERLLRSGLEGMRQIIREEEPMRPSTQITKLEPKEATELSLKRQVKLPALANTIRGDLDWIVMKALEKDRTRRYATSLEFANDILRHLHNEPVVASPPSQVYRFRKLVQRNLGKTAAAAAVVSALLVGLSLATWQALRANRALHALRASAPAFAEQARMLATEERYNEAIDKLTYAAQLCPKEPQYLTRRGDLLQCQFQFIPAAAAYRAALDLRPHDAYAKENVTLCDELIAASHSPDGRLPRASLSRLYIAMQRQRRPTSELMPVARLVGEESRLLVEHWVVRLKNLPIGGDRPLVKRLSLLDDGQLKLDLQGVNISDLKQLDGMPLGSLDLSECRALSDLGPLHGIKSLSHLAIRSTKVSDLSPLKGLQLQLLDASYTRIFDLAPLRDMPLKQLVLSGSSVTDLSPLAGMPLEFLDLSLTPAQEFAPLAGMPLGKLFLRRSRISDLSILRGMPLHELLLWGCVHAKNYRVLNEISSLEYLSLPEEIRTLPTDERAAIACLRSHPSLRQIGTDSVGGQNHMTLSSTEAFWLEWDRDAKFFEALREENQVEALYKLPDGTYHLDCKPGFRDLSILQDAPITELSINGTRISDLMPIRNLRLKFLNIYDTLVTNLSPLEGMPLERLYTGKSGVSDLNPLEHLPLRTLHLAPSQNVSNVSVLGKIPSLEFLTVPAHSEGVAALRNLPRLKRLGFDEMSFGSGLLPLPCCAVEVFWKSWDGMKWARKLNASGTDYHVWQGSNGLLRVTIKAADFTDCSIFRGASISELDLSRTSVVDFKPALNFTALERLIIPAATDDRETLKRLARQTRVSYTQGRGGSLDESEASLWKDWDALGWARTLGKAGLKYKIRPESNGSWHVTIYSKTFRDCTILVATNISWLDLSGTEVSDLRPLRGMPLRGLSLMRTPVTDLSPLRGATLTELLLIETSVFDLTPLQGMPLEKLQCGRFTSSLAPIKGLPLRELQLGACSKIADYSTLSTIPTLERLLLPGNADHIDFLRQLPRLERLSFRWDETLHRPRQSAQEFWSDYDQRSRTP